LAAASAATRLALVTGTTSGIGAALAKQLLQRGWEVAGVARRTPAIENSRYHHLAVDLRDVPIAVKSIEGKFGALLGERAWQRVALVNHSTYRWIEEPGRDWVRDRVHARRRTAMSPSVVST